MNRRSLQCRFRGLSVFKDKLKRESTGGACSSRAEAKVRFRVDVDEIEMVDELRRSWV